MHDDKDQDVSSEHSHSPSGEFRWLPASRLARFLLGAGSLACAALVFSAYLNPGMVFEFANMVFCG